MDKKTWSKYETGANRITNKALAKMREALECTESELWHVAFPIQRAYHQGKANQVREEGADAEYGTATAAGLFQSLWAMDETGLPAEDKKWFNADRNALATALSGVLAVFDTLAERYVALTTKLRSAEEDTETGESSETTDDPKGSDDDSD